jgi:23S rRNA (adenine2503-C2)-methyltransferase
VNDLDPLHPLERLPEEWERVLTGMGERPYRALQVFQWLHKRGETSFARMTNLGRELRQRLEDACPEAPGRVVGVERSRDGTRKLLIEFDPRSKVECVLIPMGRTDHAEEEDEAWPEVARQRRVTLCVSTQFGCAMGCVFCASGQYGLGRGLGAQEIVFQVLVAREHVEPGESLTNLVFMGMGEPLHHYETTARAIRLLTHPEGGGLSTRRLTVSTVGLPQGIRRLGEDFSGKVGLAVSLHAPDDETRSRIIPMNRRYPLQELMRALREYPLPRRRRLTIEYTLISNVNDSTGHAARLCELLGDLPVKVNLIPMNPIRASSLRAPEDETVAQFREQLTSAGYSCFVRARRGDDVAAACGQLALGRELVPLRR